MDLARLENEVRAVAEAIEPGSSSRLALGVVNTAGELQLRRFDKQAMGWVNVHDCLAGGDLELGLEKLREVLWPDAPPRVCEVVTLAAHYLPRLPFLKKYLKQAQAEHAAQKGV